jgi:formylglycine-generating enzyme required for sulfatase activity
MARELDKLSVAELDEVLDAIDHVSTDDFVELIRLAGLDPTRELSFGDFSRCGFDGDHLRGFNFTGCDLTGASFNEARIEGAKFDCAKVQLAALAKATDFDVYLNWELGRAPEDRCPLDPARLRDLAVFREAPFAPEMVVIPAGEFMMGSDVGDAELGEDDRAYDDEIVPGQGKRRMRIPRRFAIGRYPVTFEEYDLFCETERRKRPDDRKWGRGRRPVIDVSWDDAQAYVGWLNGKLGDAAYRLPSEVEWEYSCRAATNTRRWWGDSWEATRANGASSFEGGRTSPVDHFPANPWGLHDMIGNVWEWCADAWVDNIAKLPGDGMAFGFQNRQTQSKGNKAIRKRKNEAPRALRGGSWSDVPSYLRAAIRYWSGPDDRGVNLGFRLSRTL